MDVRHWCQDCRTNFDFGLSAEPCFMKSHAVIPQPQNPHPHCSEVEGIVSGRKNLVKSNADTQPTEKVVYTIGHLDKKGHRVKMDTVDAVDLAFQILEHRFGERPVPKFMLDELKKTVPIRR